MARISLPNGTVTTYSQTQAAGVTLTREDHKYDPTEFFLNIKADLGLTDKEGNPVLTTVFTVFLDDYLLYPEKYIFGSTEERAAVVQVRKQIAAFAAQMDKGQTAYIEALGAYLYRRLDKVIDDREYELGISII